MGFGFPVIPIGGHAAQQIGTAVLYAIGRLDAQVVTDRYTAVVLLADLPTILLRNTNRMTALLRKAVSSTIQQTTSACFCIAGSTASRTRRRIASSLQGASAATWCND